MENKTILSFSHTNYRLRSAGTEKFIRELSVNLQQAGYSHLNIFSFYDNNNYMKVKVFGVNYNGSFMGIYRYADLIRVVDAFSYTRQLSICGIHLQHLLHHDVDELKELIKKMKVPVYIMVHDYYLLCSELNLISTNKGFCGLDAPSLEKCCGCDYQEEGIRHFQNMRSFFSEISPWMARIIVPSEYVKKAVCGAYPQYAGKIVVRPHLLYNIKKTCYQPTDKINIAFAGAQISSKGYNEWEKVADVLKENEDYKLFYLGAGKKQLPGVTNIYVSSAVQGDNAMARALKEQHIQCAFLWPAWPETYSYVLYELSENGIFILTNDKSGNICDVVKQKKNGRVFHTLQECLEFFANSEELKKEVNNYRANGDFHIEDVHRNTSLAELVDEGAQGYMSADKQSIVPRMLETVIYRVKYRNRL